jgi:hypothetical protein
MALWGYARVMRRLALIGAVFSIAIPTTPALADHTPPIAHIACTNAKIAGQSKCIARGQFCAHNSRAMKDYAKYGFHCNKRDANGRWHLT